MTGSEKPRLIVGIGASAGGIQACKAMLDATADDIGAAYVVVLHLDPTRTSHVAEILQQHSRLDIKQVRGTERLKPDHVYVIAPNSELQLRNGVLHVDALDAERPRSELVDFLFASLAAAEQERSVGVLLSGAGRDGCAGLSKIHEAGGLCIAQAPTSAMAAGMPQAAIDAGIVHAVLEPEEIPRVLAEFATSGKRPEPRTAPAPGGLEEDAPGAVADAPAGDFERILDLLRSAADVNFDEYKRGTLQRRAMRRMSLKGISSWGEYADLLAGDQEEVQALYSDILIGVTEFFRDPPVWEQLARELPGLIEERDEPGLRAWIPACGTGEEAYSLAMLVFETLPATARNRVQIYATDLNERALRTARRGVYSMQHLVNISQERREQFFRHRDGELQVDPRLRDCITFAPHNALADPPFSRMDVVSCRNLLIYLKQQAHEKLLKRFHFALRKHGLLLLGRAETLGRQTQLFEEAARSHGLYRARDVRNAYTYQITSRPAERLRGVDPNATASRPQPRELRPDRRIEQFVLSQRTPATVAVNSDLQILHFYGQTQHYLVPPTGESRQDLLAWIRPGFYIRLRSAAKQAIEADEIVTTEGQIERDGDVHRVRCTIEPLGRVAAAEGTYLVTFRDIGGPEPVQVEHTDEGEPLARELEQELLDTRRELLSAVEQLEAAGEEHRASHEELLSLNEELQSSNEELEASKEELEALNEEMNTINRELEDKNADLRAANADLNNLFRNTGIPTIFLDSKLRIRRFTPAATSVMRLVPSDVGRSISHVKERFEDGNTVEEAEAVLRSDTPRSRETWTEDGRCYLRQLLPYRNDDQQIEGVCITFTDVTDQKHAVIVSEAARRYAESVIRHVRTPLMVLDEERRIMTVNPAFRHAFGDDRKYEGENLDDCDDCRWSVEALRNPLEKVIRERSEAIDLEIRIDDGIFLVNISTISQEDSDLFLVSFEDVTRDRRAREQAAERQRELARDAHRKDQWIAMLGHELRNPIGAIANGITLLQENITANRRDAIHEMLHRQTRQVSRLLDDLLDAGRIIAGKLRITKEPVDMAQVVHWSVETLGPQISARRHELVSEAPEAGSVWVDGDASRLTEVLANLLNNSAKYTEPGGRIELRVTADAKHVYVVVDDNGIGITPDFMPRIFDVFSQGPRGLDRSAKGLGLGLPLVRNIVELHGGTVEAHSEGEGKGSRFEITLPRLRHRPRRKRRPQADAPRRRILIVDDEADSVYSLSALLEEKGHTVRTAGNGDDAVTAMGEFEPEVVLLDLGMPGMNGYELAKQLRERGSDARLIVVSGYRRDESLQREAGIDYHLVKPIDERQLDELLAES